MKTKKMIDANAHIKRQWAEQFARELVIDEKMHSRMSAFWLLCRASGAIDFEYGGKLYRVSLRMRTYRMVEDRVASLMAERQSWLGG